MSAQLKPGTLEVPAKFGFLYTKELGYYRYRASYGGRGSAKSHSFADALIFHSSQGRRRILCTREIQKSIKESSKRLIEDKIEARGYGHLFDSTDATIINKVTGSEFLFAGLRTNPDAIKSMEGLDIAWIEEANRVSARSLDVLRPTLRKPTSEMWASWNPEFPTDPVDDFFRGNDPKHKGQAKPPPRSVVVKANHSDNPFFPAVLQEELEYDRRRDPEKFAWVWEGKYLTNSEARVFRNWSVDTIDVPAGLRPYYGADWGFSVDPSTLVKLYILPDRRIYIAAERYKVGLTIDDTPAYFAQIDSGEVKKWPITADSARPETIDYMRRHGYPKMVGAKKGKDSVEDGIEFMQSYDIVVHPSCRHCIEELTMYSWKVDPLTGEILPELADKNNHVIDAIRYAVESTRRASYNLLDNL